MTENAMIAVPFHGDTVWTVRRAEGVYVALKPVCEALGVAWQSQLQRITDDPVLSEGVTTIVIPSIGGPQETTCLRLELVNGWLFKIDSRRVGNEDARRKIITYQKECYAALYAHFFGRAEEEPMADEPEVRLIRPGHADFGECVRLVREARLSRGKTAALALWRTLGLPWVPEMEEEQPATSGAMDDADPVARFALEEIERAPGVTTPAQSLWPAFLDFCRRTGSTPPSQDSFQCRFWRMGFTKRKTMGRSVYLNIRPRIVQESVR